MKTQNLNTEISVIVENYTIDEIINALHCSLPGIH